MGISTFDESLPWNQGAQIYQADGTAQKDFLAGFSRTVRVDRILATNQDSIDHAVSFWFSPFHGGAVQLGSALVPAGAGFGGAATHDCAPALGVDVSGIVLQNTETIQVNVEVALVDDVALYVIALGGAV